MKVKDLKPGIYRSSWQLYEIRGEPKVITGKALREDEYRKKKLDPSYWPNYGHYDNLTKLVQVYRVSAYWDEKTERMVIGGCYRLSDTPTPEWVTPNGLREYLGTTEEYLTQKTVKQKASLAKDAEREALNERAQSLAHSLSEYIDEGFVGSETKSYGRGPFVSLDVEAAAALLSYLSVLTDVDD